MWISCVTGNIWYRSGLIDDIHAVQFKEQILVPQIDLINDSLFKTLKVYNSRVGFWRSFIFYSISEKPDQDNTIIYFTKLKYPEVKKVLIPNKTVYFLFYLDPFSYMAKNLVDSVPFLVGNSGISIIYTSGRLLMGETAWHHQITSKITSSMLMTSIGMEWKKRRYVGGWLWLSSPAIQGIFLETLCIPCYKDSSQRSQVVSA